VRRRFFGSENEEEPRLVDNKKKKNFFVVQNKHFPMASPSPLLMTTPSQNGNRRIIGILCILGFVVLSFIYNCFLLKRIHNERVQLKRVILFLLSFAGCFLYLFIDIKKNSNTYDDFDVLIRLGIGFLLVLISIFFLGSLFFIIIKIVLGRRAQRLRQQQARGNIRFSRVNSSVRQQQARGNRYSRVNSSVRQQQARGNRYSRVNSTEDDNSPPLSNLFKSTRSSDLQWWKKDDPEYESLKQQVQRALTPQQKQNIEVMDIITHQQVKDPILGTDFVIYDAQSLKQLRGPHYWIRGSNGEMVKRNMSLPQAVQLYKAQTDKRKKDPRMNVIASYVALLEKLNNIQKESKQGQRQGS
jgi:hypothetical protein